jgi:hypothetical protein
LELAINSQNWQSDGLNPYLASLSASVNCPWTPKSRVIGLERSWDWFLYFKTQFQVLWTKTRKMARAFLSHADQPLFQWTSIRCRIRGHRTDDLLSGKNKIDIFVYRSNGLANNCIAPVIGRSVVSWDISSKPMISAVPWPEKRHPSDRTSRNIQHMITSIIANHRSPIRQVAIPNQLFSRSRISRAKVLFAIGRVGWIVLNPCCEMLWVLIGLVNLAFSRAP